MYMYKSVKDQKKKKTSVKLSFFANTVSFYWVFFSCALLGNPGRIILQLDMFSPGLCSRSLSPGWASIWRRYFLHLCSSQMTIRPRIKSWVCSASITLWLTWWAASLRPVLIGRAELPMAPLPFSAIFLCLCLKSSFLFMLSCNSLIYVFSSYI